jgi:mitogen-activated protein kinase 15
MDDNKKFSIREYRESLYSDIMKRKKEQKRKWQQKFLQKLGVVDTKELFDDDDEPSIRKEPERAEKVERVVEKEKPERHERPQERVVERQPEPRRPVSKK